MDTNNETAATVAETKPSEPTTILDDGADTSTEPVKTDEVKTDVDGAGDSKPTDTTTKKAASLLDDDPAPDAETQTDAPTNAAPTDEQIAEFTKGIPATDLGDGVKWDDETLKAIAPSLMEMTGGDPKKAQGLVGAYTKHMQSVATAKAAAADAFNNGLIQECTKRFGADLKKVAGFAKRGGMEVFGEKMWGELKRIPAFANNPDIMERLAKIGMRVTEDNGRVIPKEGDEGGGDSADVLHRMYGSVKV